MLKRLSQTIQAAGKKLELFTMPDGSRLQLFSYGARGLGLYSGGSEENFFWTNPALHDAATASALFSGSGWHNTGGDRTWIAPELDTFFTDDKLDTYWQPRQLDMSDYRLERTGGGCQLSREMTLHLARSNRGIDLRLTKWFGPAPNPLRYESGLAKVVGSVEYAGYTQRITLQSLGPVFEPAALVGIWNLIQLPEGGEMLAALYSKTTPQKCFGDIPANHLTIEDHVARFNADLKGSHKVALKAATTCGRAGYVYRRANRYSLVVRNFAVNPSGEYADVQRQAPNDFSYSIQLCRVDEPEYGSFCELEYHAPALGALPDPARSDDASQVWAFRGEHDDIDAIAQKLLGAKISV